MKPAGCYAPRDPAARKALQELPACDHAVLARGQPRHSQIEVLVVTGRFRRFSPISGQHRRHRRMVAGKVSRK
jgi:hypothetical protein